MYQSIADADATITAAFLASPTPPLRLLQRYELDLTTAHANLSELDAAEGNPALGGALASLGGGLSAYSGYVAEATAEYADGHPLTGGSFLQVASEEAHLTLLPAANDVFTKENAQLNTASGQATGYLSIIGLLVLALVTGFALYLAQRWLFRRTNRLFSPGLVLASVILFGSVIWLLTAFSGARSDLDRGIGHGSAPAQNLALASIGVQQIRGDAVLNVISRSGSASFSDDFTKTSTNVDHLAQRGGRRAGHGPGRQRRFARRGRPARHDRLVRGQQAGLRPRRGRRLCGGAGPGRRRRPRQHRHRIQRPRGGPQRGDQG